MNARTFRKIVLGLDGVTEGAHMGHADFRAANGRIFASLTADEKKATAILPLDLQERCVTDAPGVFVPAAGAWGRQGWTTIELAKADEEMVGEALTLAWQKISVAKPARKKSARKKPALRKLR